MKTKTLSFIPRAHAYGAATLRARLARVSWTMVIAGAAAAFVLVRRVYIAIA